MESPSNLSALEEETEEVETDDGREGEDKLGGQSVFSPASIPPRPASQSFLKTYAPLQWPDYFDKEDDVRVPGSDNIFHVYMAGSGGPVVFCLHGGGYSGLSFALSAGKIKDKSRVLAMDFRGHGKSVTDDDLDLSIETLCDDVLAVLKTLYGDSPPAVILVGHSMGGSVAVHVAAKKVLPNLCGLVVIDVVEGTAMASLVHMQKILSSRMQYFPSVEKAVCSIKLSSLPRLSLISSPHAITTHHGLPLSQAACTMISRSDKNLYIEWSVKGGPLRNVESARVSIPSTLEYDNSKKCYAYRTPLEKTEKYWKGWYEGLSEMFLSCPVPKLLLLAGTDRLDRSLTIGQMQGKFQMVVVRHTGHAIQEDVPDEFASLIINFISRNRIGPNGVEGLVHLNSLGSLVNFLNLSGHCIQFVNLHGDILKLVVLLRLPAGADFYYVSKSDRAGRSAEQQVCVAEYADRLSNRSVLPSRHIGQVAVRIESSSGQIS
ncbi:hypothetical protein ZIOFF_018897 [Zingiber officinale]|uniref:protein phosphatase methylesterase-1 n=1 Tax=Zingiber officinale TaxID=94328 RepID=A0A8J5HDI2_ZINOF|nr:hypothetical protein ZIOFF_018897 [Zingiber officinale]